MAGVSLLHTIRQRARVTGFKVRNLTKTAFECPICEYTGAFRDLQASTGTRLHALCPNCGSFERHRLQYIVVAQLLQTLDAPTRRMLHFAPEPFFRQFFRQRFRQYETADLNMADVDHHYDIQDLPAPDASYDFIFASHVLEHVADDQRAIREIRRILRPGGIAVLPVPLVADRTVEYPAPNPHETNHVRAPGPDYFERYEAIFSRVDLYRSDDLPEKHQLYVYEDRTRWPTPQCPLRPAMSGFRHIDIVPVCHA